MDANQLLEQIRHLGNPSTARVLKAHGARDPVWGAKIGDMKPLIRGVGSDPSLAQALFDSGVYDAMYLAALTVNGADLDEATLERWARLDYGGAISASTVPWLAVEHPKAAALAQGWLASPNDGTQITGWCTWAGLASTLPDSALDLGHLRDLLDLVPTEGAGPEVRSAQVSFAMAVAVYVEPLRTEAAAVLAGLGPAGAGARASVEKALGRGLVKKRKTMKC